MEGSLATAAPGKINLKILPFIRTYRSGHVNRLYPSKHVPPSVDPCTGVSSRDVAVNPIARHSDRLYLSPSAIISQRKDTPSKKLPVIVYYHGSGLCAFSASSSIYHTYLNSLIAQTDVVAVSVDYHLAPKHLLPVANDDSWEALLWVAEHAFGSRGLDTCLTECGDYSKLFLDGDSAGANIVHNMGFRLGKSDMEVEGLTLVHPYFWGKECMNVGPPLSVVKAEYFDALWPFVCPGTVGLDDPMGEDAPSLAKLGSWRVLVSVAERDLLRERGRAYYERLRASECGGEAELFEMKGKDHVFHVFQSSDERSAELMRHLVKFFHEDSMVGRDSLLMGCMGIRAHETECSPG